MYVVGGDVCDWTLQFETLIPLRILTSLAVPTVVIALISGISCHLSIRKTKGVFFILRLWVEMFIQMSGLWWIVVLVCAEKVSLR